MSNSLTGSGKWREIAANILIGFVASLLTSGSIWVSAKWRAARKEMKLDSLREREIFQLDASIKAMNTGLFNAAIMETFNALSTYLYRELVLRNEPANPVRIADLLSRSKMLGIISEQDDKNINIVREMRNKAAHGQEQYTKADAEQALEIARSVIK